MKAAEWLGWERGGRLLGEVAKAHGLRAFGPCVDLASKVSSALRQAGPEDVERALRPLALVLVDQLPPSAGFDDLLPWERSGRSVPAGTLAHLLKVLGHVADDELSLRACEHILQRPSFYPMDGTVVPALIWLTQEKLPEGLLPKLLGQAVGHLQERSATPLECGTWAPLKSWRRP